MIQLKQRLLFVHKGIRRAAFPRLMNADKVRADNQTGRTKGISLSEAFHSDLSNSRRPPSDWWGSSPKNANKKKGTLHRAPPPTGPCVRPHLPDLCPPTVTHPAFSPLSQRLPPTPVLSWLPHGSLWPILHLPKPTADARCVKKVRSSGSAEAPSLPLHRGGLPRGFIIICRWHSAQVQAQCKRWHQRGGMRLATHLVISCP